jgi:quinol monooxygenase YgiN
LPQKELTVIPEIIRYKIPTAHASEFVQAYGEAGQVLRESPHCRGFELLRSAKDPELFLLIIQWDSSEGHLAGFRRSALFPKFFALIKPYVGNILEMEHYAVTDVRWTSW